MDGMGLNPMLVMLVDIGESSDNCLSFSYF